MGYLDIYEAQLEEYLLSLLSNRMFMTVVAVAGAVIILELLSYVFHALGMSAIAKHRGIRGRWMAWLPFVDVYMMGNICDRYLLEVKGKQTHKRKTLLGLYIALLVVTVITSVVGAFLGVAATLSLDESVLLVVALVALAFSAALLVLAVILLVQQYIVYYHIYYSCHPDSAAVLTVLSVFFPVIIPFVVFALRHKVNGMPPSKVV